MLIPAQVRDASRTVPRMMMLTTIFNGALGLAAVITASFITTDIDRQIMNGDPNYPYVATLADALGSTGGAVALAVGVIVIQISKTVDASLLGKHAMLTRRRYDNQRGRRGLSPGMGIRSRWVSIITFVDTQQHNDCADSRHSGLPFSSWFTQIRVVDGAPLPVNSILASLCICVVIALLNLGGDRVFNSIIGLLTGALGLTYALSIGCVLWRRCCGAPLPHARWSLGRWGVPFNVVALLYMVASTVISFFPLFNGTGPADMNWSVLNRARALADMKLTNPCLGIQVQRHLRRHPGSERCVLLCQR